MPDYEFYEGASTGQQIDEEVQKGCLVVQCGTVSALPFTKSNANILSSHAAVKLLLGTPTAQASDWTVSTSNGSLTINGEINGSTTVYVTLVRSHIVS